MQAVEKYNKRAEEANSLLCVGLDPDPSRVPPRFHGEEFPQFAFNRWIVEQTHEFAAAFKPNAAFYEARGARGMRELEMTMEYLRERHPDIFTIYDAKRGDIGNTNEQYASAIFDELGFDAVTLHPYAGGESLAPFLRRGDKASIVLCRTSNPGAGELQDVALEETPFWQLVTEKVVTEWNKEGNCMLVVGAPYPDELRTAREIAGEMTFLVPGVGSQGGEVSETLKAGLNREGKGMIINASRSVIFADDPGSAARELRESINTYR